MAIDPIASLRPQAWWDAMQAAPVALLYKHSPFCGTSAAAQREVCRFATVNPALPVYQVDVIRERDLSRRIAEALDVPHASPQVILLRAGSPVWVTSHRGIRAEALHGAMRSAGGGPESGEPPGPGECSLRS